MLQHHERTGGARLTDILTRHRLHTPGEALTTQRRIADAAKKILVGMNLQIIKKIALALLLPRRSFRSGGPRPRRPSDKNERCAAAATANPGRRCRTGRPSGDNWPAPRSDGQPRADEQLTLRRRSRVASRRSTSIGSFVSAARYRCLDEADARSACAWSATGVGTVSLRQSGGAHRVARGTRFDPVRVAEAARRAPPSTSTRSSCDATNLIESGMFRVRPTTTACAAHQLQQQYQGALRKAQHLGGATHAPARSRRVKVEQARKRLRDVNRPRAD